MMTTMKMMLQRRRWRRWGAEARGMWRRGMWRAWGMRWALGAGLLALGLIAVGLMEWDAEWLRGFRAGLPEGWTPVARSLSFWGDYPLWSLGAAGLCWGWGAWRGRRGWRRAGLAALLAASVGGMGANVLRLSLGRPRPSAGVEDGFYGLRKSARYHSFPSGHSATAFGTAAGLAVAAPALAAPALLVAGGVVWSRLALNRHYPSDVLGGAGLGVAAGLVFGLAARGRRR